MAEALAFEVMLLLFEIASVATLYCTCFSEVVSCLECTVELRRMQGWPGCRLDCDCRCWSTYSTVQYSTYPRHPHARQLVFLNRTGPTLCRCRG
ncbi:hypothetical protein DL95DRAFT_9508 [Leptodontidium sp. 2 PMI_412]|nr:hypothetical protein DL95DRAFT_9508 [Leptodontidium sp. 2 PMI_412]